MSEVLLAPSLSVSLFWWSRVPSVTSRHLAVPTSDWYMRAILSVELFCFQDKGLDGGVMQCCYTVGGSTCLEGVGIRMEGNHVTARLYGDQLLLGRGSSFYQRFYQRWRTASERTGGWVMSSVFACVGCVDHGESTK